MNKRINLMSVNRTLWSLFFVLILSLSAFAQTKVLYEGDSLYYHLKVTEEGDYRYLAFDRTRGNQSVYNTAHPDDLKFPYTRAMFFGLAYLDEMPKRALFVGLGGGTMPRIMNKYMPNTQIDAVEIDPDVVKVARQYFGFEPSTTMKVFVQDGRQFLRRTRNKYDIVFLDAFNTKSIPFHLTTQEFFEVVKQKLNPKGVVVSNVWSPSSNQYHYSQIKTLQEAFPRLYSFQATGSGNFIFVSPMSPDPITKEELQKRVEKMLEETKLPFELEPFMDTFEDLTDKPVDAEVLTDDFAPVDTLRAESGRS